MIIIKLWGGLGNQLFQIAFGYMLQRKFGDSLIFDTHFYSHQYGPLGKRKYVSSVQFPNLQIQRDQFRPLIIRIVENRYISYGIRKYFGLQCTLGNYHLVLEKLHHYYSSLSYKHHKINYYDGYWQSEKYFIQYRDELLKLFTPTYKIQKIVKSWRDSLNSDCCVAVHIRRGDYLRGGKGIGLLLDIQYYKTCIHKLQEKLKNPLFCIFSDDIEWCKNQLATEENIIFVENKIENGDIIDLFSIAACDHGIMSLSTFSWWSNWLRKNQKNSIVIYPSGNYFNQFFFPSSWICINNVDKL